MFVLLLSGAQGQSADPYLLRGEVLKSLTQFYGATPFAHLAELSYKDKRVALVWPWLKTPDGRRDDDILGLIYTKSNGKWKLEDRVYEVSHSDVQNFYDALGTNSDYTIHRPPGIQPGDVSTYINKHLQRTREAWLKQDIPEIMRICESLARMFSLHLTAWRDGVTEMILKAIEYSDFDFAVYGCAYNGAAGSCEFDVQAFKNGKEYNSHGVFRLDQDATGWRVGYGDETMGKRR